MTAALAPLYVACVGALALWGIHRFLLLRAFRRSPWQRDRIAASAPRQWPTVTVQLPIYNERNVVERLVEAAGALRYPRERLEIQVLDDSTDDTADLARAAVAGLQARGLDADHVRRPDRRGYKAGALDYGLRTARGELIAIFDADFVPQPDFLERLVGEFDDAPDVGMVQARWGHINRDQSVLTRAQSALLDGHFVIEHTARAAAGHYFNFNGTAGLWRRAAIDAAGGWEHDTLTEDLDLSYRAQLAGWRFVYRPDVVAPAEVPADLAAFKNQQHRWARGSAQVLRKLGLRLLRAPIPWRLRIEALAQHLGAAARPAVLL
ncbi:MAG: glycosyltransferase, partial [Planctomycetota bacterium]